MLPVDIHFAIDQGLQNIGSFIYQDIREIEIDLQFNRVVDKFIRSYFDPKKQDIDNNKFPGFEEIEVTLDDLRLLREINVQVNNGGTLPIDYLYLINDRSLVDNLCTNIITKSGDIELGNYYKVKGSKSVVYNGDTYVTGDSFIGINIKIFTYADSGTEILVKLQEFENRLTKSENLHQVLRNYYDRPKYYSPISTIDKKIIKVYTTDFIVDALLIDYIRKPLLLVWDSIEPYEEFPEDVIGILIDLTVKRLLEMTQSKRYETKSIEDS